MNNTPATAKSPDTQIAVSLRACVAVFAVSLLTATACRGAADDETAKTATATKPSPSAVDAIDAYIAKQTIDKTAARWKTGLPEPPLVEIGAERTYTWVLDTNKGEIKVALLPDVAPKHAVSTIYLTRLGFYDGLTFHRVIPGFMAQGGCPLGTGTGGPGYKYAGEFSDKARHDGPGMLSMANAGPNTDGSQFFLTFRATPHLDGKHTIFGRVVEGDNVLKALEQAGSPNGRPREKLEIRKATIVVE